MMLDKYKQRKRLFEVTVTKTTVETWKIGAASEEEAKMDYKKGEKMSSDTLVQVSDCWRLKD